MNKLNTILAAVGALLMLTVTSANSVEIKAGVSANGLAAYANAKEQMKGNTRVTNEEAVLAASFANIIFIEVELLGDVSLLCNTTNLSVSSLLNIISLLSISIKSSNQSRTRLKER